MVRPTLILVLLAAMPGVRAQDTEIEVPAVTPPGFSQVIGKYHIASAAAPTEVFVEEPITLKVQIIGQGPEKYRPERKHLHIFPEDLADDFHLEEVADQVKALPEKGLWEFVYRLRPKREDVARIPGLRLLYYAPGVGRFQSSFADEIAIKVKPRQETTAEKLDLKVVHAPERFYQLRPMDEVLRDDSPIPSPSPLLLTALLAMPPFGCFLWYRLWRRLYPNATEKRARRRSRAARWALAYLDKQVDDVPRTRAALVDFLRQRLDFPALEATPNEVARHLKSVGFAKPLVADWVAFLQTCDRMRFAPPIGQPQNTVHAEAIRLVHAVEGDPCVSH